MTAADFLATLRAHPDHGLRFILPDDRSLPAHFHITELGHLAKSFIDCGGTRHVRESCLLQAWVADDVDHRLTAGKLAAIFDRSLDLLPSLDLPVELEAEAPVLTQLPLVSCAVEGGAITFFTELKRTDCLAKELCLPDFSLPSLPGRKAGCAPGSGCC